MSNFISLLFKSSSYISCTPQLTWCRRLSASEPVRMFACRRRVECTCHATRLQTGGWASEACAERVVTTLVPSPPSLRLTRRRRVEPHATTLLQRDALQPSPSRRATVYAHSSLRATTLSAVTTSDNLKIRSRLSRARRLCMHVHGKGGDARRDQRGSRCNPVSALQSKGLVRERDRQKRQPPARPWSGNFNLLYKPECSRGKNKR